MPCTNAALAVTSDYSASAAPPRRYNSTAVRAHQEPSIKAGHSCGIRKLSESERERIILDHLQLVKTIALSIRRGLPIHVEAEDLVQAGRLGLIDAVNKYDPDKQSNFSSYAKHRIRGAIGRNWWRQRPLS